MNTNIVVTTFYRFLLMLRKSGEKIDEEYETWRRRKIKDCSTEKRGREKQE